MDELTPVTMIGACAIARPPTSSNVAAMRERTTADNKREIAERSTGVSPEEGMGEIARS
jgi:hypothetical protein